MAFASVIHVPDEENNVERRLIDLMNQFLLYENQKARNAALAVLPLEDLRKIAEAKHESCCSLGQVTNKCAEEIRDLLLLELLGWFKSDFFTWMDSPPCQFCKAKNTTPLAGVIPTFEEKAKSAARVETFTCLKCFPGGSSKGKEVARFARYNDPVVLLETRTGRCGEWANCFALICRAMEYETRHVTDWTDHVWVEVFSITGRRWLHCDPCENKCDIPLLYEAGWGKQLTYVIAVSQDDIQDVTWRYSHSDNHKTVLSRRKLVRENWLVDTITRLRKQRQSWLPEGRKKVLEERLIKELVEFLSPTKETVKDGKKVGRESGSLAWRLARGEIESAKITAKSSFEWDVTGDGGKFNLTYDCVQDKYIALSTLEGAKNQIVRPNWVTGVFSAENIIRKEEHDWKMVYLARKGDSNVAKISWKFFSPPDSKSSLRKRIKSVELTMHSVTFHSNASVKIEISSSRKTLIVPQSNYDENGKWNWKSDEFKEYDCDWILVTCILQGGTSWQHAQLFRQKMSPDGTVPFSIEIITEAF